MKSARRIRRSGLSPEQLHHRIAGAVSHADYVTTLRTLRRIGMELRSTQPGADAVGDVGSRPERRFGGHPGGRSGGHSGNRSGGHFGSSPGHHLGHHPGR